MLPDTSFAPNDFPVLCWKWNTSGNPGDWVNTHIKESDLISSKWSVCCLFCSGYSKYTKIWHDIPEGKLSYRYKFQRYYLFWQINGCNDPFVRKVASRHIRCRSGVDCMLRLIPQHLCFLFIMEIRREYIHSGSYLT